MRLGDLLKDVEGCRVVGDPEVEIGGLSYSSSSVTPGCLFFCVPGFVRDGHDFAPQALAAGAVALCVERQLDASVPQIVVSSVRGAMGLIAACFHGFPSRRLQTAGITGTNGKTTSAFLTAHLLDAAGRRAGLLGTVERRIGGRILPAGRTTPEAVDTQQDLAAMVTMGDRSAVMEVSSHALDQGRVVGTVFEAVAFTNLTQDHLDYHRTLEAYFEAKQRLFTDRHFTSGGAVAVVNVDDPFGRKLAAICEPDRLLTCSSGGGTMGSSRGMTCSGAREIGSLDLEMSDFQMSRSGTEGVLRLRGRAARRATGGSRAAVSYKVSTRLLGRFNVDNVLISLGLGLGLGLEMEGMIQALAGFRGVPGRMEQVDAGQPFTVLVDYAHSPDSVKNALATTRALTQGRLIAVLGCGGERDRGKRPKMGSEAEAIADLVVVTSDNPRGEDPLAIIEDVIRGLHRPADAIVEPDRRAAIRRAVRTARAGDIVMILGKGHESGQQFSDRTVPFDDREVAAEELAALTGRAT